MSEVGRNIKEIIAERGIKQGFAAKTCGYSEKVFSAMVNGRRRINDADITNISSALNVEPNRLFGIQSNALADPL